MTEVYYPTVDVANVRILQFIVVKGDGVEAESEDTTHRIEVLDSRALSFRQINTAKNGAYTITKTYTTDPLRHTVLVNVQFRSRSHAQYSLYVYYDPSLNNSGMHDSAWTQDGAFLAADADKTSALISSTGFDEMTNGYFGVSDGYTQLVKADSGETRAGSTSSGFYNLTILHRAGHIKHPYDRAMNGNVVQVGRVRQPASFTLALGFGKGWDEALRNAHASLTRSFASIRQEYNEGWRQYLASLRKVDAKYQRQFNMAAVPCSRA